MGATSTKKPQSRVASFPFARAFVVQFVEQAGSSSTKFKGRVEHLESGERASFGSREALLGFLTGMLVQARPRTADEAEMAEGTPRSRRRGLAANRSGDAKKELVKADQLPKEEIECDQQR